MPRKLTLALTQVRRIAQILEDLFKHIPKPHSGTSATVSAIGIEEAVAVRDRRSVLPLSSGYLPDRCRRFHAQFWLRCSPYCYPDGISTPNLATLPYSTTLDFLGHRRECCTECVAVPVHHRQPADEIQILDGGCTRFPRASTMTMPSSSIRANPSPSLGTTSPSSIKVNPPHLLAASHHLQG